MTDYRLHGLHLNSERRMEIGIFVGKSDKIRFLPIDRTEAWKLTRDLIRALDVTEDQA